MDDFNRELKTMRKTEDKWKNLKAAKDKGKNAP